jgi:hypothetical protein
VIETSLKDLVIRSSAEKQQNLQRSIDVIIKSGLSNGNILIHYFSDGGSNKAVEFAEAYHARIGRKLPCQALCLDSTPGHPRYLNYAAAFPNLSLKTSSFDVSGSYSACSRSPSSSSCIMF